MDKACLKNTINKYDNTAHNTIQIEPNKATLDQARRQKIPVFSDRAPGKSQMLPMKKRISEQPSPWRKSSERESCYGDRVYTQYIIIIIIIIIIIVIIIIITIIICVITTVVTANSVIITIMTNDWPGYSNRPRVQG